MATGNNLTSPHNGAPRPVSPTAWPLTLGFGASMWGATRTTITNDTSPCASPTMPMHPTALKCAGMWVIALATERGLAHYGVVRPLAVDARQPKTVYVAVSEYTAAEARHVMLISEDDGKTWQELPLP